MMVTQQIIQRMNKLFEPSTIALVGASTMPAKWGYRVLHNLLQNGYTGTVFPINPKGGTILGLRAYKSIHEVPSPVDLALITIPREKVFDALKECVKARVGAVMVITSGFSEAGDEYTRMEKELAAFMLEAGVPMGGPNGQGVMNAHLKMTATMQDILPPPGHLSIVSQSGNICGTISGWMKMRGFGVSKFISSGNEAMLTKAEYFHYYARDPLTKAVACYVEGVREGRSFFEALQYLASRKPVVVLKGGKTSGGMKAAASHTGSLASSYRVFAAAVKQAGAVLVETLDEFFDMSMAFQYLPLPRGKRVAILSEGGGWGVLSADAVEREGLELIRLPDDLIRELDEILPPYWSRNNPIDMVASRGENLVGRILERLVANPEVDAVLYLGAGYMYGAVLHARESRYMTDMEKQVVITFASAETERQVESVARLIREYGKPIVIASDMAPAAVHLGNDGILGLYRRGVPVYPTAERAVRALAKMVQYGERYFSLTGASV